LSPGEREPLITKLLDLYRNDPDSGIHGAAEWTLRQWKQQEQLKAAQSELSRLKDRGERRWYVNSQGQTFTIIDGPVEFRMGSPLNEPDRGSNETLHRRVIPRRFAIADKEVTVMQYQEFVKENPRVDDVTNDRYSPDLTGPMNEVSWYDAAAYCNWLNRKENLPECYEPNEQRKYAAGMRVKAEAVKLAGYRLPTEAEWEYACRAGAMTSRYYGSSERLLGQYAWYRDSSRDRAWPGGSLKPNDLGLFDMLGNVIECCQDPALKYQPGSTEYTGGDIVDSSISRRIRGGTFSIRPANVRSAERGRDLPAARDTNYGFRLARTCN
jgi:formylglycine-generating enzyme required for sulfatase activity